MRFILNLSFATIGLLFLATGSALAKTQKTVYLNEARTETALLRLNKKESCDRAQAAALNRLVDKCLGGLNGTVAEEVCVEEKDPTNGKIPFFEKFCVITCNISCAIQVAQ